MEVDEWFDFSCPGQWEQVVADVEAIFRRWGLVNTVCRPHRSDAVSDVFNFRKRTYRVTLHSAAVYPPSGTGTSLPPEGLWMTDQSSDFNIHVHEITRWFGVRDFVECRRCVSQNQTHEEENIDESTAYQLLSSISIALSNCDTCIPAFVVAGHPRMGRRLGSCQPSPHQGVARTRFESGVLLKTPRAYNHVDGLIDLFKAKISETRRQDAFSSSQSDVRPLISVRYTWMLNSVNVDWPSGTSRGHDDNDFRQHTRRGPRLVPDLRWRSCPRGAATPPLEADNDRRKLLNARWSYQDPAIVSLRGRHFDGIPIWGELTDPLRSLHISVQWPAFYEGTFVDNAVYSSFRKMIEDDCLLDGKKLIGRWSARANWSHVTEAPLSECVRSMVNALRRSRRRSLDGRETRETPTLKVNKESSFLSIESIVKELFENVSNDEDLVDTFSARSTQGDERFCIAAPAGSFLSLLAMRIMDAASVAEARGVHLSLHEIESLWKVIVSRIRRCWEDRKIISRLGIAFSDDRTSETIDLRSSLLQQKMSMINVCIRYESIQSTMSVAELKAFIAVRGLTCRDCVTKSQLTERAMEALLMRTPPARAEKTKKATVTRVVKHDQVTVQDDFEDDWGDFKSADDEEENSDGGEEDGVVMKIDVDHAARPMTSDTIEEQRTLLGISQRVKNIVIHTDTVRLNIHRVLVANPSTSFEDFIRWQCSKMSLDMQDSKELRDVVISQDSIWRRLWNHQTAGPSSRSDQDVSVRCAFDARREAEIALQWIENMQDVELLRYLSRISVETCGHVLCHAPSPAALLQPVTRPLRHLRRRLHNTTKIFGDDDFDFACDMLSRAERALTQGTSLLHRLPGHEELVTSMVRRDHNMSLISTKEELRDAWRLCRLSNALSNEMTSTDDFDDEVSRTPPSVREAVCRTVTRRDQGPGDMGSCHRMYALLHENEFRVAISVSESEFE